jgi:hypothetical protein
MPTKRVHYASDTVLGLFENPFRMNLRAVKPWAVIKGISGSKKCIPVLEFLFYASQAPFIFLFATSQLPAPQASAKHCNVPGEYTQVKS